MTLEDKNKFLKSLNEQQFLNLGAKHIAYMRELQDGQIVVHNATGQPMAVAENPDAALKTIAASEMKPVPLH